MSESDGVSSPHGFTRPTASAVGFVVTKPLQIMTSLNLWDQLGRPEAHMAVVAQFADAAKVTERLAGEGRSLPSVYGARSRAHGVVTLAERGVSRAFVDSDVGIKTPLAMRLARLIHRQIRFSLYEEGTGTVEIPEADRPGRLSRALGAVSAFGESRLMEEVWTYSPAAVRARLPNRNVMPITRSLADFVRCNRDLLMDTFWPSFHEDRQLWRGRRCCLYLSSWEVQAQAYSYLASADAFTICKLHPHIRDFVEMPPTVDQLIRSSVPAELLILELARVFEAVEVVHHGTATESYIDLPNVDFAHLDSVTGY